MAAVVVIGAGVIGASIAFRMAQAGADVTILEADRVAGGTSTRSFAWSNAHNKVPRAYYDLNHAGMRAHADLVEELGDGAWLHAGGCVEWTATEDEFRIQRARMARLLDWGYAADWIDAKQLRALEPDIDEATIADRPIAYYPDEGWLDPAPFIRALLSRFAALGGIVRTGARVADIIHAGGATRGARLRDGTVVVADIVVNCAGAAINSVTPDTALHVPMASTLGLLAITAASPTTLRRVVQGPGGIAFRPDGAGRVIIHSKAEDENLGADTAPSPDLPAAARMVASVARLLPAIAGAPAEAVRIATRPIPEDGLPAIGTMPGLDGYHVVVTHSGVTLASLLGRLVADEALGGTRHAKLDAFRPDRFFQVSRGGMTRGDFT